MIKDWKGPSTFRFAGRQFDPGTGEAHLSYQFDEGPLLTETLVFPYAPWPSDATRQAAFFRALEWLHLVAGVSYYKAGIPPLADPGDIIIDESLANSLNGLYEKGLAEFAHVNGLELAGRGPFRANGELQPVSDDVDLPERALIAIGGGKDSLVSLDRMKKTGMEVQPFCVGGSALIRETVSAAQLPLIAIQRKLAPELKTMNEAGAWNGHVPITAINSAIGVCVALLYGFRYIVFSNERSADESTLFDAAGRPVNHQYSKGFEFEQDLRTVLARHVTPGVEYFSLLRPLYEVGVARRFAELTEFHDVFSSCNRNFHQDGPRISGRWCGDCPKCRFTTLALAPFMSPDEITAFMGQNLLDDTGQLEGFRALCALGADKPFECVGTAAESRAALAWLAQDKTWSTCAVVRDLSSELDGLDVPALSDLLEADGPHAIPKEVLGRVEL